MIYIVPLPHGAEGRYTDTVKKEQACGGWFLFCTVGEDRQSRCVCILYHSFILTTAMTPLLPPPPLPPPLLL